MLFTDVLDMAKPIIHQAEALLVKSRLNPAATVVSAHDDVLNFQDIVRKVPVAEEIVRYAVRLAAASRPHQETTPDFLNEWASWGAGTRAGQFLVLGGKVRALLKGRAHVTVDDVRALAQPTLRHRILLNYRAEAEGITVAEVIKRLLDGVKPPLGV